MTNLVAICGSLRNSSYNSALIAAAREFAPEKLSIASATIGDIPMYNEDIQKQGFPESITDLAERIRVADGVLISTPEYNYSIPGVLKNAIDWLSRLEDQPFAEKPVAIMGASMGMQGTSRAQYHLRQVFVFLDGRVMNKPEMFVGSAHNKFDSNGKLIDETTQKYLIAYFDAVIAWCESQLA